MVAVPDKLTYKTTVTNLLRQQMGESLAEFPTARFLEIGSDVCYTTISLAFQFSSALAVELDPARVKKASQNLRDHGIANVDVICGTSGDIPEGDYHVILVDAAHDRENVRIDILRLLKVNRAERFTVFLHDYGLRGAGVKEVADAVAGVMPVGSHGRVGMEKDYNPLGGATNDFEAYVLRFTADDIPAAVKVLEDLRNEGPKMPL